MNQRHRLLRHARHLLLVAGSVCLGWSVAHAQRVRVDWGPFDLSVGFNVGTVFSYTDNADNTETDPREEFDVQLSLGPTVVGGITLPFTLRGGQELVLQTSFSYTYNISLVDEPTETFSSPISATLSLPIPLGKWVLVVSDSFTFRNEPLEATFAVGEERVAQYSNIASVSATRQFGKFATTFAAQRTDRIFPDNPEQDENQHQLSFTPAFFLREGYSVFLRNTVGLTDKTDPALRDSFGYSTELGVSGRITPNLNGTISVGWAHSEIQPAAEEDSGGIFDGIFDSGPGVDRVDGISSTIALNYAHPLRPNTVHAISFFRSPGVTAMLADSDITEVMGVTYNLAHRLSRYVTLAPIVSWVSLKDLTGEAGEKADIVSIGLGFSRQLTRQSSASFNYQYQMRSSNLPGQSYEVNRVTVTILYTF